MFDIGDTAVFFGSKKNFRVLGQGSGPPPAPMLILPGNAQTWFSGHFAVQKRSVKCLGVKSVGAREIHGPWPKSPKLAKFGQLEYDRPLRGGEECLTAIRR